MPIMEQANKQTILKYEALHIAILTKVLTKDEKAAQLSSIPDALNILNKKISVITKSVKFTLYNSEMFYWSLYGLTHVLQKDYPDQSELLLKCNKILSTIYKNIEQSIELSINKDHQLTHEHMLYLPYLQDVSFNKKFQQEISQLLDSTYLTS